MMRHSKKPPKDYHGAPYRKLKVDLDLANEYERRFLLACKHVYGYPKYAVLKALMAEMPLNGPDPMAWREEFLRYAMKLRSDEPIPGHQPELDFRAKP